MKTDERLTQAEKIAMTLKKMIILKKIQPGERINQEKMSKELGVSKIPFREALKVLEAEGFVYSVPFKGSFVREHSLEYLQELYFIRSILEGISCSQATARFQPTDIERLRELFERSREGFENEDYQTFIRYAEAFHDFIHEHSGFKRLPTMIHQLNIRSLALYINPKEQCERSIREHEFIFERIEARDAEGAGNAMRMHVQRSGMDTVREIVRHLEAKTIERVGYR